MSTYHHGYPKSDKPVGLFRFELRADGEVRHIAAPIELRPFVEAYKRAKMLRTPDIVPIEVSVGNTAPGREVREYLEELVMFSDMYAGPQLKTDLFNRGLTTLAPLFRHIIIYTPGGFRLPVFLDELKYN